MGKRSRPRAIVTIKCKDDDLLQEVIDILMDYDGLIVELHPSDQEDTEIIHVYGEEES